MSLSFEIGMNPINGMIVADSKANPAPLVMAFSGQNANRGRHMRFPRFTNDSKGIRLHEC
ncbi:MAG: hypothetical protein HC889_17785 [Synechococcaceae cyanobacterium SM1_2_3]|nr:hypothetical protein [Synechococcaceae cyanobacterium SM1_2_3]